MTESDPDLLARRTLRQHRLFATGLLVLMAALTLAQLFRSARLVERLAASRRQSRLHRRHRGLVRCDGAVSPPSGHTNSPYRHHSQPARPAGPGARAFRGRRMSSPAPRSPTSWRGWTCRASCIASWPTRRRLIRRRSPCRACCRSCWRRWRTAAPGGSWRAWCRASWADRRRAMWWRGRCTAWSMAAATRRCSVSSSGR